MKNLNPTKLFLLDGLGALLSAALLGLVVARFEDFFGMPSKVVNVLALIPCFFAAYSLLCYWCRIKRWQPYLRAIAVANLLYCCLTTACMLYWKAALTVWGFGYFILEIIVVVVLSFIELKAAGRK